MHEPMMKNSETDSYDQSQGEGTPLDDIISRVDSYIKNPDLVTPETLGELKSELEDLKSVMDTEEGGEEGGMPMEKDHAPSLTIAIGRMRGKK